MITLLGGSLMAGKQLEPVISYIRRLAFSAERDQEDSELLNRFVANGDEASFAMLVARHGPLVWRACKHALDQEQDAEDVFQATFMVLAQRAGSIRKSASVGPWLFGVAQRLAMKAKRASQ